MTSGFSYRWRASHSFNPCSRVGSDYASSNPVDSEQMFQSTLPRGERLYHSADKQVRPCFNPRSRVGSDAISDYVYETGDNVSIHAPAWGATIGKLPKLPTKSVSIHAPAWGATGHQPRRTLPSHVSIHAPAWGATSVFGISPKEVEVSIHAPAWGATA